MIQVEIGNIEVWTDSTLICKTLFIEKEIVSS